MAQILPIIEVTELPKKGEPNTIYRQTFEDDSTTDYIWTDPEYQALGFDMDSMDMVFSPLVETISDLQDTVEAQAALIEELEEAVFPIEQTSFEMLITSLMMVDLDLYDENDEIVPNMGLSTEYWEEPQELVYQNEVKKGTYYLKNEDGYALGKPNGDIQPLVCEGGTVDLGSVEVIQISPKKGGMK